MSLKAAAFFNDGIVQSEQRTPPHHQGIHVYAIDADADEIAVEAVESSGENHVDTTEDTYCRRLYVHYFLLILILLLLHFTHAFLYSFVDGTAFKNRGPQESASCMSSWKVPPVPVNLLPLYAVSWHGNAIIKK
jgi:hypothetical protein